MRSTSGESTDSVGEAGVGCNGYARSSGTPADGARLHGRVTPPGNRDGRRARQYGVSGGTDVALRCLNRCLASPGRDSASGNMRGDGGDLSGHGETFVGRLHRRDVGGCRRLSCGAGRMTTGVAAVSSMDCAVMTKLIDGLSLENAILLAIKGSRGQYQSPVGLLTVPWSMGKKVRDAVCIGGRIR